MTNGFLKYLLGIFLEVQLEIVFEFPLRFLLYIITSRLIIYDDLSTDKNLYYLTKIFAY